MNNTEKYGWILNKPNGKPSFVFLLTLIIALISGGYAVSAFIFEGLIINTLLYIAFGLYFVATFFQYLKHTLDALASRDPEESLLIAASKKLGAFWLVFILYLVTILLPLVVALILSLVFTMPSLFFTGSVFGHVVLSVLIRIEHFRNMRALRKE